MYKSLVFPMLLYCSPIWTPDYDVDIYNFRKIMNHKFMRYLAFKDGSSINKIPQNYENITRRYSVATIRSLHNVNDPL